MKTDKKIKVDFCIIGAGITGLWLLNHLKALDYSVILLEKETIGGTQTLGSQGIIHGGIKYSLQGSISSATEAISTMPQRWRNILAGTAGNDNLNLADYPLINCPAYYLWIRNYLPKISGFFASRKLHSRLTLLDPDVTNNFTNNADQVEHKVPGFLTDRKIITKWQGRLYKLNGELVINVPLLIRVLAEKYRSCIFSTKDMKMSLIKDKSTSKQGNRDNNADYHLCLQNHRFHYHINATQFITAAGAGTASILKQAGLADNFPMQLRPLHMLMVRHPALASNVFMHIVGWSDKPLLTITSHRLTDDDYIWYLGGNLAEQGVTMEKQILIQRIKTLLTKYFSIDWNTALWDSFEIQRAEPAQAESIRPDQAYYQQTANLSVCWPTKLTLVPSLTDQLTAKLKKFTPSAARQGTGRPVLDLPTPAFGLAPWEKADWARL